MTENQMIKYIRKEEADAWTRYINVRFDASRDGAEVALAQERWHTLYTLLEELTMEEPQ